MKNSRISNFIFSAAAAWTGLLGLLGTWEIFFAAEKAFPGKYWLLIPLLVLLITVFIYVAYAISARWKLGTGVTAVLIFLLSLILKIIFVRVVKTPQYSDFQLFHWITTYIAKGQTSYLTNTSYFQVWAYQVGFPALMAPVARLFDFSIDALVTANVVYLSLSNMLVFLIAKEMSGVKNALLAAVLFMFWPLTFSLAAVYTNQHAALFFVLFSVYIIVLEKGKERPRIWRFLLAGALLAVSNMARPEASVIIIAFAIACTVKILYTKSGWHGNIALLMKTRILPPASAIAAYFAAVMLINLLFIGTGYQPLGLVNKFPLYKVMVGLNHESLGAFNAGDAEYATDEYYIENSGQRDAEAKEIIKERMSAGLAAHLNLQNEKLRIMWTAKYANQPAFEPFEPEDALELGVTDVSYYTAERLVTLADGVFTAMIFLLCACNMVQTVRQKKFDTVKLLSVLAFLGFSAVFFVVEVQMRYRFLPLALLFLCVDEDGLRLLLRGNKR